VVLGASGWTTCAVPDKSLSLVIVLTVAGVLITVHITRTFLLPAIVARLLMVSLLTILHRSFNQSVPD